MAIKKKRKIIYTAVALFVLVGMVLSVTLGFLYDLFSVSGKGKYSLPDVVAMVNNEEITGDELEFQFEQLRYFYEMQGVDLNNVEMRRQVQLQILQEIINETLLFQGAQKEGISVSDSEVEAEYEEILSERFGGDEEALEEELANQNLTTAESKENIARRLKIEEYIAQYTEANFDEEEREASEEDLQELYEEYLSFFKDDEDTDVPDFEELKPLLQAEWE